MSALRRRGPAAVAVASLVLQLAALILLIPNSAVIRVEDLGFNGVGGAILGLTYPILGWILTVRRPENRIGWLFIAIGLSQAGTSAISAYTLFAYFVVPGAPLGDIAVWLGTWTWVPGFVLLFVVIALFPDGTLISRRWLTVPWLGAAAMALIGIPAAVAIWPHRGPYLASPTFDAAALHDPAVDAAVALSNVGQLLVIPVALGALASIAIRFRRSRSLERLQIRWFALAAGVEVGVLLVMSYVTLPFPFGELVALFGAPLMPVAMAIAILRYRLYDIDRIVSRTISWTVVTGVLAAVFAGVVVALQALLAGFTQGDTLAVAASTLAAAALFQPVRGRVQRVVDRRFDRARVDTEMTVTALADRLRDRVDLVGLEAEVAGAVVAALRPSSAAVWIRGPRG